RTKPLSAGHVGVSPPPVLDRSRSARIGLPSSAQSIAIISPRAIAACLGIVIGLAAHVTPQQLLSSIRLGRVTVPRPPGAGNALDHRIVTGPSFCACILRCCVGGRAIARPVIVDCGYSLLPFIFEMDRAPHHLTISRDITTRIFLVVTVVIVGSSSHALR